ncbi:MAG: hypothetical protein mread185_000514 [Mycoplasmataceae bacterium]|nr:MAG: hypothetical protein mread185_000514 [Mycoplasmataceae bacterium]
MDLNNGENNKINFKNKMTTQKNPYLINDKLPEISTISYFDFESDKNLTWEEYQQLHSNNYAEITLINKSGSNFRSEKEGYGPVWGDGNNVNKKYLSNNYKKDSFDPFPYCSPVSKGGGVLNDITGVLDKEGYLEYVVKGGITATTALILGPETSIKVGGLLWGTSRIVEGLVKDEDLKQVLRFIGDISRDTAKGEFYGKIFGLTSDTLASKTTQEIGHFVAKEISSNGGKIAGDAKELIAIGKAISLCQKGYRLKEKYDECGGRLSCEIARHEYHKDQGRSYDSDCSVCNP